MDTVMRLSRAKNIDIRQQTLLEAAYFSVKPSTRVARVVKQRTVLQQYVRFLLEDKLSSSDLVEDVIKCLRRLPWLAGGDTDKGREKDGGKGKGRDRGRGKGRDKDNGKEKDERNGEPSNDSSSTPNDTADGASDEPERGDVQRYVIKSALRVSRTKYVSIPNIADCLSGLSRYYPDLIIELVDRIFEELQRALDTPYKREIHRMLGLVRLLGEL